MEKILQIIPAPVGLKIVNMGIEGGKETTDFEDIVCLALIENSDMTREVRPVVNWLYGLDVIDRLHVVTKDEMIQGTTRTQITFINKGE